MATRTTKPAKSLTPADSTAAVDVFMATLEHPQKAVIQAIRESMMGADASIAEGIKWNAPSFRTTEYFATTHLREKTGVGIILHQGAKVRDVGPDGLRVPDPAGLLKWLAKDRAAVVFRDLEDFRARRAAWVELIRAWIKQV